MKVNLPQKFSQNDPRWKDTILGTKGTIGAYGCLMTDATMTACYYGHNETPLTVNEKMKNNGGYQNGNLFVWGVFASLFNLKYSGQFSNKDPLTKANMDQIRSQIDKGYPVFLQIDTIPSSSQLDEHWILAIDYDGDDFIVQDPWDGATKRITSWGVAPQKLIYAWCWYEGKVPQGGSDDQLIQIKKSERDWLVFRATTAKEVAEFLGVGNPDNADSSAYKSVVNGFKGRITDLEKQLTDATSEKQNREEQVSRLKGEVLESQKREESLQNQLKSAGKSNSEAIGVLQEQLKGKQTLVDSLSKEKGSLQTELAQTKLALKNALAGSTSSLTLYDVLILLVKKAIPFLKNNKLS